MAIEKVYKENAWDEVNNSHQIVEASSNSEVNVGAGSWADGLSVSLSKGKWIVCSTQYFTGGTSTAKYDCIIGKSTGDYISRTNLAMPNNAFCITQTGIIEITTPSATVKQMILMSAAVKRTQSLLRAVKL